MIWFVGISVHTSLGPVILAVVRKPNGLSGGEKERGPELCGGGFPQGRMGGRVRKTGRGIGI